MTENWDHKDEWRRRGKDFLVSISRHNGYASMDEGRGLNRWAVYAYIYPKHPLFKTFVGDDMFQDAAQKLPLHGGVSFLEWHHKDGVPCSVQVGADYDHLHDQNFTHYATAEEAQEVFIDANHLFNYLQEEHHGKS